MKPVVSKRTMRIEKKKKKMAALLEISKLNENDRLKGAIHMNNSEIKTNSELEPSPKRLRIEPQNKLELSERTEEDEDIEIVGPSGKPKIYGEELLELKRLLRAQSNKMKAEPKFRLREIGEMASLNQSFEDRIPIFLSDVQHLLLFSQIGNHSPYSPSRWCQLERYSKLQNTNVLIIENISLYHYQSYESMFPFLTSTFPTKVEIITSGAYKGDVVQDLATVPVTGTQMHKYLQQFDSLEEAAANSSDLYDGLKDLFPVQNTYTSDSSNPYPQLLSTGDKFPRTHLLLSGWQMVEENYPLPIKGLMETKYVDYVLTKDSYKPVTAASPMFGIDCEMCRTTCGDLEVTRISVVDEKCEVFYEQLVKPHNKIVDYLTRFSGITPKMMRFVTKRLQEVQEDLRRMLPADAILVGQSLSSDMHALKMMHPYVIDTSVIYNITGDRMRKTKLQTLAREFLSQRIQEGDQGHCSVEDSLASLKLAQHKLQHDVYYGDAVVANVATQVRHHPTLGNPHFATSMLKQTTKLDKKAFVVGLDNIATKYDYYTFKDKKPDSRKINCVSENCNENVIKKFCEMSKDFSLNIAHLRLTDEQLKPENVVFKGVDKWVKEIYENTTAPGLCIVLLGGQRETGNGCCFITVKKLP